MYVCMYVVVVVVVVVVERASDTEYSINIVPGGIRECQLLLQIPL